MEEAQRVLEEAIPLAEAVGDLDILRQVLTSVAHVYGARGALEQGGDRCTCSYLCAVAGCSCP
jgi:hypothetical protein